MTPAAAAGLAIMVVSETATLFRIEPFWSWNTPIAWTGFIIFADSIVFAARGSSWIRSSPAEFAFLAVISIPLWLVFEFYNRFIENWYYVGLPEDPALRLFGYAWSFATIWPAIFEGAELVAVWRRPARSAPLGDAYFVLEQGTERRYGAIAMAVGAALLLWPIVYPSRYLAAPVWLGFIFLLDPLNAQLGAESLTRDFGRGEFDRFKSLALGGLLCGVLWEFWNYWSRAKWHYTVPIMTDFKIFEMPLPGYLGFSPFALECFTMYVFLRGIASRFFGLRFAGRPIGVASHEAGRRIRI
jgi:hypothetical protein